MRAGRSLPIEGLYVCFVLCLFGGLVRGKFCLWHIFILPLSSSRPQFFYSLFVFIYLVAWRDFAVCSFLRIVKHLPAKLPLIVFRYICRC